MSKDLTQNLNGSLDDKLDRLITAVQSMDSRFANIGIHLENLGTRLENLETRVGNVESRLESLEVKVDERMKETRPMWEALQTQLTELKEAHQTQFAELRESQEKGFRRFDHAMDVVSGNQNRLHADHVELESRVYKIEKRFNE